MRKLGAEALEKGRCGYLFVGVYLWDSYISRNYALGCICKPRSGDMLVVTP